MNEERGRLEGQIHSLRRLIIEKMDAEALFELYERIGEAVALQQGVAGLVIPPL